MGVDALSRGQAAPASPLIDPRMRDRQIGVARGNGRRRLRRVLAVVVVLTVVGGAVAATRSPLLDVDHLAVTGASQPRADEVRSATEVALGEPLIDVDLGAVESRVEALPWVERVTVERGWPSTLRVHVEERTPVGLVGDQPSWEVDRSGRVLGRASTTSAARLPRIAGPAPAIGALLAEGSRPVAAVFATLPEPLRDEVASASGGADGVELELRDGIVVRWGDAAEATAKAEALRVLLGQDDRGSFEQIDVRVPRASTITFRGEGGE